MTSEVTDLINALRTGDMTLDEVASRFRLRSWPEPEPFRAATYVELATRTLEDPEPPIPGSFDDVTAAYDRREITSEQYRVLSEAVAASINAEARGER
jgi:hypothetical protein